LPQIAQVGWTEGVILNVLGYYMEHEPSPIIALFPKDAGGEGFLDFQARSDDRGDAAACRMSCRRKSHATARTRCSQRVFRRLYQAGRLELAVNVKSFPCASRVVEEPDDCALNTGDQGDSITLVKERNKTWPDAKTIIGGTPTIDRRVEHRSRHGAVGSAPVLGAVRPLRRIAGAEVGAGRWTEGTTSQHAVSAAIVRRRRTTYASIAAALWTNAEKNRNVRARRMARAHRIQRRCGFRI
jgi:hypothetical protein